MREAPRIDRQRIVKGLVVGTLGLAVLVGSPALRRYHQKVCK